ncbi:MAG: protein-arginine deiminase domain-containing protein, partial [Kiritimatiellaeota bacterium]|nr:protein-arginine deiminase domain-containing protein [Kiritimatiellota bacterium]
RRYHDDFITFYPFGHSDYAAALHGPGFSNCCACAEHSTPPESGPASTNASGRVLSFVDSGLLTRGGEGATNALPQGSALMPGDPVHVTGLEPSTAPDDRAIRVQWDEGGQARALTNTFTVASVRMIFDALPNGVISHDEEVLSYDIPEGGFGFPAGNPPRLIRLHTDVKLPGELTLALSGGAFRVWPSASTNGAPLLTSGGTVTNGAPVSFAVKGQESSVYIDASHAGTAELTYRFEGSGAASNITCSFTLPLTAYGVALLADTDRDGIIGEADEQGKAEWDITRGALIPPCYPGTGTNAVKLLPQIRIAPPDAYPSDILRVFVDPALMNHITLYDAGGLAVPLEPDGGHTFYTATNLYVAANAARKTANAAAPDGFDLTLTARDLTVFAVVTDKVRLKTAPLILPCEYWDSTAVYSTTNITATPPIPNFTVPSVSPKGNELIHVWTQDMVKFAQVQVNGIQTETVAVGLGHLNAGNLMSCLTNPPMFQVDWSMGLDLNGNPSPTLGNGGNIMATAPLEGAPYGKIMIGTKWPQTKAFWERQGIQPVINIDTSWLVVGHVDELFMWVAPNKVLYADPWIAADLLHNMIVADGGMDKLWCGYNTADKTNTIAGVVIDNNRSTRLLAPMNATTNNTVISCERAVFKTNDYLRVGDEILRVVSTNANTCTVGRARAGHPATTHASNDVIYALSPLMRKNLIGTNSVVSKISVARNQLRSGLGSYSNSVSFSAVPVLFNNGVVIKGYTYPPHEFAAVTANLANCLVVNQDRVHYSDPGSFAFKAYFNLILPGVDTFAVDVWATHHCQLGEIHCGTAVVRSPPAGSQPWWKKAAIQVNWENER